MIRFALYEGRSEFIELRKELEFISGYLKLEAIRTSQRSKVVLNCTGESPTSKLVPTFLITTLVENALKHGGHSTPEPSCVKIDCRIENETLTIQVFNSEPLVKHPPGGKASHGGSGLPSLHRRLELYFPQRHRLRVTDRRESFMVYLQIPLRVA